MPRAVLRPLPFSFRKGSQVALITHVTEYGERPAEHGGASRERRQSTGEPRGSTPEYRASHRGRWPDATVIRKSQFGLGGPLLALGYSCPA